MKKIIKRAFKSKNENIHIKVEDEKIVAKILYSPVSADKFSYILVIGFKKENKEQTYLLGCFNMVKAKYLLGKIIIKEDCVIVAPTNRKTLVYNIHEDEMKEYVFSLEGREA